MRLTLRLSLSLIFGVAAVSLAFAFYQTRTETQGLTGDLDRQSQLLAESLAKSVEPLIAARSTTDLQRLVDRFHGRERIAGVAIYRMQRMRAIVRERNIYRWAGTLIGELCEIRPQKKPKPAMQEAAAMA